MPPRRTRCRARTRRSGTVIAGETVDIDLPARDPESEPLEYEIVDGRSRRAVQMRDPARAPDNAGRHLRRGRGGRPGHVHVPRDRRRRPVAARHGDRGRHTTPGHRRRQWSCQTSARSSPTSAARDRSARAPSPSISARSRSAEERASSPTAATYPTLPSTKCCVSRRNFRIRIKRGDYRKITVSVNGKRVKVRAACATPRRWTCAGCPRAASRSRSP